MAKREGIMLCYWFDEKRFNKWPKPVYCQPKLEGDRCRALISFGSINKKVQLLSSGARDRNFSVPHIVSAIMNQVISFSELDGELFKLGMNHNDIRSRVAPTVYKNPKYHEIEYHIFDLILDGVPQDRRLETLDAINFSHPLVKVPTHQVYDLEEYYKLYEAFLLQGHEGIITRHPRATYTRRKVTTMMKDKPRILGKFKIVGCAQEHDLAGNSKDSLGALVLEMPDTKLTFSVGTGFTRAQRIELWREPEKLIGQTVEIAYQEITPRGVPKMQSFKRFVTGGMDK